MRLTNEPSVKSYNKPAAKIAAHLQCPVNEPIIITRNVVSSTFTDAERLRQEEALTNAVVKSCPSCQKPTYKIDGCNYMDCSKSDPVSNCRCLWCFQCQRPKYRPLPNKVSVGCCNDVTHNSH
jgi:hypothetical protein